MPSADSLFFFLNRLLFEKSIESKKLIFSTLMTPPLYRHFCRPFWHPPPPDVSTCAHTPAQGGSRCVKKHPQTPQMRWIGMCQVKILARETSKKRVSKTIVRHKMFLLLLCSTNLYRISGFRDFWQIQGGARGGVYGTPLSTVYHSVQRGGWTPYLRVPPVGCKKTRFFCYPMVCQKVCLKMDSQKIASETHRLIYNVWNLFLVYHV